MAEFAALIIGLISAAVNIIIGCVAFKYLFLEDE